VFSDISASSWRAVIDAAHRHSLPVMGHVPAGVSVLAAAQAGQRSDEHLTQIFEACSTIERTVFDERHSLEGDALTARIDAQESRVLEAYDQRTCDHVAAALAMSGQAQVPTLILPYVESKPAGHAPASDARWQYLRADERTRWLRIQQTLTVEERAVAARRWPVARKIVTSLHHAGAVFLAGTDTPMPNVYPGFSLHEELALLVESGLSPAEALRSATLAPASFLGIADRSGSVSVGKRADLVLLDANPLTDIRNTRRIRAVVLDGRVLTRTALDALLADAAKAVADTPNH
jgi:imidazolonepropionase-like amidohydrolase